jgi:biotin synthase
MAIDEIIQTCKFAVKELNFKALVLQSGLDPAYAAGDLATIIDEVMKDTPALLILSIGERDMEVYKQLYARGARGVLLRFETSNPALYEKFRPGYKLPERIELIRELKALGYMIFTGFLIGLPAQTEEDILNDIRIMGELNTDMFSFGPFIPHPDTPLGDIAGPTLDSVLTTIARTRIMYPQAKILATSALETLDRENGLRLALLSGANSLMINLTPEKYRRLYDIYPDRAGMDTGIPEKINSVVALLQSIGRAPADLGI